MGGHVEVHGANGEAEEVVGRSLPVDLLEETECKLVVTGDQRVVGMDVEEGERGRVLEERGSVTMSEGR